MKFILVVITMGLLNTLFLLVSDAGWIAITSISASFFSLVGLVVVALINKKVNTVKESIDGLLEQKSKADKALGVIEGIEAAAKEEGIANKREVEIRREQDLKNQPPPNQPNRDVDMDSLEKKIHQKGDEIKKSVETKGDEIHEGVKKVPDEVVDKLKPPNK